jgi:choline kinase
VRLGPDAWGVYESKNTKSSASAGTLLVQLLEQVIDESRGLSEYEDALHLLTAREPVHAVDVTGLPWTEVDFAEDLRRARATVFPEIARIEGG